MAEKKLSITIDGTEVVCNFGINYFYKHFHELTGKDLLVDGFDGITSIKLFDIIPSIYCAGYFAQCSLTKKDPGLKYEQFVDHVLSMDESGAAKMLTDYTTLVAPPSGENPGE